MVYGFRDDFRIPFADELFIAKNLKLEELVVATINKELQEEWIAGPFQVHPSHI